MLCQFSASFSRPITSTYCRINLQDRESVGVRVDLSGVLIAADSLSGLFGDDFTTSGRVVSTDER